MKKNNVEFGYADASQKASGYSYYTKADKDFTIEPNDLIVKVDQQKAVFAQVLFEPNQKLNDSLSYDITAWALPLAYGVDGYALKNSIAIKTKAAIEAPEKVIPRNVYAFHIPWNNRVSAQVLSLLHQNNIKVRSAMKKAVFGEVAKKINLSPITVETVRYLIDEKRIGILPLIFKEVIVMDDERRGFMKGTIEGNDTQIDPAFKSKIESFLKGKLGRDPHLDYVQNPNVTAGYKVTVEDLQLDASLDNQLEQFKQSVLGE